MNNTMILAIGHTGCQIATIIQQESRNPELLSACYVFADSDKDNLNKYSDNGNRVVYLQSDFESFDCSLFENIKQLIIVAAMGGDTGSKYSILIANVATIAGVQHIKIFTILPFLFEGMKVVLRGIESIKHLNQISETSVEIFNLENYSCQYSDLDTTQALKQIDKDIARRIGETVINL